MASLDNLSISGYSVYMNPGHTKPAQAEHRLLLEQLEQMAAALGATFAPFCEVVVHDLTRPKHSIVTIHNPLSGRQVGAPSTDHGLRRISDPTYPQVVANYSNRFADGRQVKSTSVGFKNSKGRYVASLCLNVDLTLFQAFQGFLGQFTALDGAAKVTESLDPAGAAAIRARIDEFAAHNATTARSLRAPQRRQLVQELKSTGMMDLRRSATIVARHLGVSRATVYSDFKAASGEE
jgi:predicted transcriptional regulator YheO